jgi:hypothetical protein
LSRSAALCSSKGCSWINSDIDYQGLGFQSCKRPNQKIRFVARGLAGIHVRKPD